MTINEIYDISLYLAEKTDDSTGFISAEYKKQHQKKAEIIIRQAIRKYVNLQNLTLPDIDMYGIDEHLPLDEYPLKNIIPYYVGAIMCAHDKETDKYNLLIYEYQTALKGLRYDETQLDIEDALTGLR